MTKLLCVRNFGDFSHLLRGITWVSLALLAGCASAPEQPQSMVDPQANFGEYKTFALLADHVADGSEPPMSLADNYIRTAITTEMLSKGYSEVPEGSMPDILIDYEAARAEKVKSKPFRIGIGVGSYGSHGGASIGTSTSGVENISEGSLVIHAIDTARDAEVWRSQISRELGGGAVDSQTIANIVTEVLSDFPVPSSMP